MASRSWNRVELIGNLTRDPELRFTPNGAAVCTFGVATNRSYLVDGERREEVEFHKLVAWNKLAELCSQLLKKGARVFLAGRLQYREWETQDGQKRRDAEITIEDMILLTSKDGMGGREDIVTMDDLPSRQEPVAVKSEVSPEKAPTEPEVTEEDRKAPEEEQTPPAKKSTTTTAPETVADEDLPF